MKKNITGICKLMILPVGLFLIFSLIAKGFGLHSIQTILSQSVTPIVMAYGMSLLMTCGLMDFSIGARSVLAAIIGGMMAQTMGIPGLILGCLIGAIGGSFVMALVYHFLKIPMMVVSLGIVMVYEVLGAWMTGSTGYLKIDKTLYVIGSYPYNLVILLLAALICYFIYYKTAIGCYITAVGNDEKMCQNVGVNPAKVKFIAVVLTGVFAALAGLLTICYSGSIVSTTGMGTVGMFFKPLICVILGRQMRRLVDNMPLLIIIGGLSVSIIFNGFIALGFQDSIQDIVLGLFLVVVLGYSSNSKKITGLLKRKTA